MDNEWKFANFSNNNEDHSVVLFVPDINMTPAEHLVSPADWKYVTNLNSSEEGVMQDFVKIAALYQVRDEVYIDGNVRFHENVNNDIEV